MPLPTSICLALATGIAAALAGRTELRMSPRHPLLTMSFGAYVIFASLVLVPAGVYFYVFHGDWFLLYLLDVQRIPSAIALVGFLAEIGIGALGFALGATLLRSQRDAVAGVLIAAAVLVGGGVPAIFRDRLSVAGSFAQFEGGFGLAPFGDSPLFPGTIAMWVLVVTGLAFLLGRLATSTTRS